MSVLLSGLIAFCVGLDEPNCLEVLSAQDQPTCSVVVVSDGAAGCCVKTLNLAAPATINDGVVRLAAWTPDEDARHGRDRRRGPGAGVRFGR